MRTIGSKNGMFLEDFSDFNQPKLELETFELDGIKYTCNIMAYEDGSKYFFMWDDFKNVSHAGGQTLYTLKVNGCFCTEESNFEHQETFRSIMAWSSQLLQEFNVTWCPDLKF